MIWFSVTMAFFEMPVSGHVSFKTLYRYVLKAPSSLKKLDFLS